VAVLRDGRLVTAGLIEDMEGLAGQGVLVRAVGDLGAFAAALATRGLSAEARPDGLVHVGGPSEDAVLDGVRDAAVEAGAGLRELRAAGPTLEDALVEALE
jgi:hypothetical protein